MKSKLLVKALQVRARLLQNALKEVAFGLALSAQVYGRSDHCQSQSLDLLLALHEPEVACFIDVGAFAELGSVAHELLAVSVGDLDAAELLKDGLERVLGYVLEPFTQIWHR